MNTGKIYVEAIANEYSVKETSKVAALKKLDNKVKLLPNAITYVVGVVSTLALGVGMCLSMGVLGNGGTEFLVGSIALGVIGIVGTGINYPIYKKIMANRKERYANDIIWLAAEISEEK